LEFYLGIDLGTSSLKMILINEKLEIVDFLRRKYQIYRPKSEWVEQSPMEWLEALNDAFKTIISKNNLFNKKLIIGVTGQMHGVVFADQYGRALTRAIIWPDNRASFETEILKKKLSQDKYNDLANPIVEDFSAAKIMWFLNNRSKLTDKLYKILLPKDFIVNYLTGRFITEESDASGTLLFNVKNREWNTDILNDLNISKYYLPSVHPPGARVGNLKDELKEKMKINQKNIPVVTAGGDAPMAAVANGINEPGEMGINIGTAGQIMTTSNKYCFDQKNRIHTLCHGLPGKWFIMGAIKSSGFCLSWWNKILNGNNKKIGSLIKKGFEKSDPISANLIFLPYLNGERSPHLDPNAGGAFFGLKGNHSNADMVRAILEGVAFAFKQNWEVMKNMGFEQNKLIVTGRGGNSSEWCQIISDVFQKNVYSKPENKNSAFGAAISAASSAKNEPIEKLTSNMKDNLQVHEYNQKYSKIYENKYQIFKKLYSENKNYFNQLNKLK